MPNLLIKMGSFWLFLWAGLKLLSSYLCLPSVWDFRCVPPHPSQMSFLRSVIAHGDLVFRIPGIKFQEYTEAYFVSKCNLLLRFLKYFSVKLPLHQSSLFMHFIVPKVPGATHASLHWKVRAGNRSTDFSVKCETDSTLLVRSTQPKLTHLR
jgi:hypothetical protein